MSGQYLTKVHRCEPPENRSGLGNGTQWQCDCGRIFEIYGRLGWIAPEEAAKWRLAREQ